MKVVRAVTDVFCAITFQVRCVPGDQASCLWGADVDNVGWLAVPRNDKITNHRAQFDGMRNETWQVIMSFIAKLMHLAALLPHAAV